MSELLDRNLETLIRRGALPLGRNEQESARRDFLKELGHSKRMIRTGIWGGLAMAVSIGICAWVMASLFQSERDLPPPSPPSPSVTHERLPGEASIEPEREPSHRPSQTPPGTAAPLAKLAPGEDLTVRPVLVFDGPSLTQLELAGRSSLPSGALLFVSLSYQEESWVDGRIEPKSASVGSGKAEVHEGRFAYQTDSPRPGLYAAEVELIPDLQTRLLASRVHPRKWTLPIAAWGDELAPKLGPRLRELDQLSQEALSAIAEIERATATETLWKSNSRAVLRHTHDLMQKMLGSEAMKVYPASLNQVYFTLRSLAGAAPFFVWKEGVFDGPHSYHAPEQKLQTHRQEPFTFGNFKRYVAESDAVAGRELALWVVKDIRRGGLRPAHGELLKKEEKHPGLAPVVERLLQPSTDLLPALEKEIRGR